MAVWSALRQRVVNHVPVYVSPTPLDAVVVVEAQTLVIQAEQVKDRRVQVVDGRDLVNGLVAEVVGRAVQRLVLRELSLDRRDDAPQVRGLPRPR